MQMSNHTRLVITEHAEQAERPPLARLNMLPTAWCPGQRHLQRTCWSVASGEHSSSPGLAAVLIKTIKCGVGELGAIGHDCV